MATPRSERTDVTGGVLRLLLLAPLLVLATVAAFAISGVEPQHFLSAPRDGHRSVEANSGPVAELSPQIVRKRRAHHPSSVSLMNAAKEMMPASIAVAVVVVVSLLALLAVRINARATRQMERIRVVPGRSSEASPAQIAGLIESIGNVSRDRWWVRFLRGTPPAATLELVSAPDPSGGREQTILIAVPKRAKQIGALQGVIANRYPDASLTQLKATDVRPAEWVRAVIRLKKARDFVNPIARPGERSLEAISEYGEAPVDVVLAVMAEIEERTVFQLAITPAPNSFQWAARRIWMRGSRDLGEGPRPGAVRTREERASTEAVAFRPLSFVEIRVGAETHHAANQVAGAVEGIAEGGENHLRRRRPIVRRRLYVRRVCGAESNPMPSFLRGVYSSVEIAALWHLPTPYAKSTSIRRSNVPQLPVPPDVLKLPDASKAIATDLNGTFVGIRQADYRYGVQVVGMAGGGKTSLLAKIAEARAREPNTAVIIIDPKGELCEAAASVIPPWRVVRLLDFARPLFGIALRTADRNLQAEASIFSEAMVDVSRTEEGDSQALNASQRSFKMARQATLALENEPTFWHTARWLASDDDAAAWRARKIAKLAGDPRWHAVWDHFARILPAQLQKSPGMAAMRLEAPYNKMQTLLGDERLNMVLHHPISVSLDDVIRRREVMLIAGRAPVHPDAIVVLKFYIQLIHRAILGQQQLPEDERANVAAIFDDTGELLSPTIARMAEHDRSAGLELVLAWQHGGQVSRELAPALDALCNSRIYFRPSEEDARAAANRLNPAYDERMTAAFSELRRRRVEVNQLTSLEQHHAIAVLQTGSTLSNSFTLRTIPWRKDPARMDAIDQWMRDDGAYEPEVIAPPKELTGRGENADVDDLGGDGRPGRIAATEPQSGPGETRAAEPTDEPGRDKPGSTQETPPARTETAAEAPSPRGDRRPQQVRRGKREAEIVDLGTPTDKPLSEAYREVEDLRDRASSIKWEESPAEPPDLRHNALNAEQRSVLDGVYELRVLSAAQIQREFLIAQSERQVRRELALLLRRGMVSRFELGVRGGRGRGKRIYVLDGAGFDYLKEAADHSAGGRWRAPELRSPQHVVHDLARNEWLFALRSLVPRQIVGWRGPRSGKIEVPLIKEGREAPRRLAPVDLRENAPVGFDGADFENIVPDLTVELELPHPTSGEIVRTDLLLEIEWGNNNETVRAKAMAYDAFLSGWWRAHRRYGESLGRPPIVFFVVPDVRRAKRFIELLDECLQCHLVGPAETQTREQRERGFTPTPGKMFLGRRNIFVAVARDVHQRTLRAWRVPSLPPKARIQAAPNAGERRKAGRAVPRPFMLIKAEHQIDPAR